MSKAMVTRNMIDSAKFKAAFQKEPVIEYKENAIKADPLVSIIVMTYNHKNYIKNCLEGVLSQKTDFQYEVIVGEDESKDGTREICIEYADKYPDKIRLFLHKRANNITISGQNTGRFNFCYSLFNSRGKYIALCEGDDYWTDPFKLQSQVGFLETNPEYVMSYHDARVIDEREKVISESKMPDNAKQDYTREQISKGNTFILTLSLVFRNIIKEFPEEFFKVINGDNFLTSLLGSFGKGKFFTNIMPAVYRSHAGGVWSALSEDKKILTKINTCCLMHAFYKRIGQQEYALHFKHRAENSLNNNAFCKSIYKSTSTKINIAMLTPSFWPVQAGMEIVFHNLATSFVNKNNDVFLFAPKYREKFQELQTNYTLARYGSEEELLFLFKEAHKKAKFDVLFVQSAYLAASTALRIRSLFNIPVVLRTHGEDIQIEPEIGYGQRLDDNKDSVICDNIRSVDFNIVISKHVKCEIEKIDPRIQVKIINNGVDSQFFRLDKSDLINKKFGIPNHFVKVLTVGRNVKKKSFHLGLEAFSIALNENPNMVLIHAGKTGNGDDLQKIAKELNIESNFLKFNHVDYYSMPKLYNSCDLFIFPSKAETFGTVTIEAMSCGLPCVEFDYGANKDKILHGINGYIVPYGDTKSMAFHLLKLIKNRKLYNDFSTNARQYVVDNFSWNSIGTQYVDTFKEAIDGAKVKMRHSVQKMAVATNLSVKDKGKKIVFVAYGPNQINGPNIWLQRILPELQMRGFKAKVIFFMASNEPCNIMKELQKKGIDCIRILRQEYTENNIVQLLKILQSDPPDVFIPNLSVPAYYSAKWAKEAGIPTIGVIRSDDIFNHELVDCFGSGDNQYQLSGVVCKSKFLKRLVLSKCPQNLKILCSASGTYLPEDTAREPGDILKLVYTGRLIQLQKRIFDVIQALKQVIKTIPECYATLYGQEREGGQVIQTINRLKLGERLKYGGVLKIDEIFPALIEHHVFVLLSDYEGMSTSLMEAMSCGLVPICTKTRSGALEIIRHNENGLLVDNRDDDFITAVKRLKYEKGLWSRLSKAARKTIEKEYTIEICADRWAIFLDKMVEQSPAKKTIRIPNINEIKLPPVKVSDNGICREDRRIIKKTADNRFDNLPKSIYFKNDRDAQGRVNQVISEKQAVLSLPKAVIAQSGFPAVSATFILDQITGLTDRGFSIESWATYNPREPFVHKSVTTYGLMDITRYLGFPPESLRPQPALWVQEFVRLNGTRNWDDIGVFHVHYGLNFNHLQPIFRHFTDKPVLVSFHGHDGSRYIRQHGDACYDYLFERACMITTPSAAMKEKLVALGCSPEKIRIHRYGIDLESFRPVPAKASGLPFTFLTVGRLVEKKGIEYALRAFAQLPDRNDVRYRIVGEGPLREKLSALTRRLGIEDSVSFLGAYSKEEVVREMSAADVFVLTSVTAADGDQEGLPVSLIEAQAMGLPVVSSRHAGIPELVQHGATGFLAGEKDVAGISEFLRRLVSDHSLRSVLSINGRKRAEAEFNIRLLNDTLAGYLIEAAEMGRNPAGPGTAKYGLKTELTAKLDEKGWTAKAPLHVPCFESVRYLNHVRNPAISIIVISWRLHPDTPLSLERLSRQRSQHYELIFVDNGGESGAFACLEPHVDTFVRLNRNTGAYLARNAGALFAKAPILLFLDDDCIPAPGLISAHLDAFRKYDVLSVRGCIVPKTRNPLTRHAAHYHLGDKPFPFYSDVEGNTSYHSSVFYQVGGWDDDIRFGGGGVDLAIRILDIEPDMRKQIYSPEPLIYHDYAQNPVHLQDKREKQEQSHARLRCKHSNYDSALKRWSRFCGREDLLIKKGIATACKGAPEVKSSTPITIVIPTYNRAGYLRQSLESALSQSPPADEILVVDDGSTDGTEDLMAEFAGRVRYIRKEHSGAPDTRNYAIKHASGKYILWLDSDDVLLGDVLGKYRNIAERNSVVDVIYGNLMITDGNLAPQRRLRFRDWEGKNEKLLAEQVMGNRIPNPGTMIKKECYEKVGFYNPDFPRAHDYEFWSRTALELNFKHCGDEVLNWRWHDKNMSSGSVSYDTSYEARIIEGMLQRYPLSKLFPDLSWETAQPERIEAAAYLNLSKRFLLLDQRQLAIKYLRRSYRLHSKDEILKIIQELQSFGQAGLPRRSQPDLPLALAG